MNQEQLTAALTDLRDTVGRHMNCLDQMGPAEQETTFRADLKRLKEVTEMLETYTGE